jgi:hypothetical protein
MATIVQQNGIRVAINSQNRTNIRTVGIPSASGGGGGTSYLRDLIDVNATSLIDGYTLVYDSATNKFIVKELSVINGGTF